MNRCGIRHRNRPCKRCRVVAAKNLNSDQVANSDREISPSVYATWTKRELLDETEARGLDGVGSRSTKSELLAALERDDA